MLAKLIRAGGTIASVYVITGGGNAHAEILITTAAISGGELVIVGRVRRSRDPAVQIKINPNKTVQVESTSTGGFRWIGLEFPSTWDLRGPQARWVLPDPREIPAKPLNKSDHKTRPPLRVALVRY
jgi:hypothetical protein